MREVIDRFEREIRYGTECAVGKKEHDTAKGEWKDRTTEKISSRFSTLSVLLG